MWEAAKPNSMLAETDLPGRAPPRSALRSPAHTSSSPLFPPPPLPPPHLLLTSSAGAGLPDLRAVPDLPGLAHQRHREQRAWAACVWEGGAGWRAGGRVWPCVSVCPPPRPAMPARVCGAVFMSPCACPQFPVARLSLPPALSPPVSPSHGTSPLSHPSFHLRTPGFRRSCGTAASGSPWR